MINSKVLAKDINQGSIVFSKKKRNFLDHYSFLTVELFSQKYVVIYLHYGASKSSLWINY